MFLREPFGKQCIANRPRERDVDDPVFVHVADFRARKAELAASKAMRVDRNLCPRPNDVFEFLECVRNLRSSNCWMLEQGCSTHQSSV